jgi:hypothetical protein
MAYIPSKNIVKSKTFWVNVAMGVAAFLTELPVDVSFQVAFVTAVNVALRYLTKQPVTVLPEK